MFISTIASLVWRREMNGNLTARHIKGVRVCDACGEHAVRMSLKDDRFVYGTGDEASELVALVPVWTCDRCGYAYTDGDAEDLRHEAVCSHLGVLSPAQIRAIREKYGMTQGEFAKATGFGLASVKRWETGALIQNHSADRLLRLLGTDRAAMTKLLALDALHWSFGTAVKPVFRTEFSAEILAASRTFTLRPI
jgi:putative zinc finger/helix-turn-helix YgiT family protein